MDWFLKRGYTICLNIILDIWSQYMIRLTFQSILILLLATITLQAQEVELGLKGGLSLTEVQFVPRARQDQQQNIISGAAIRFLNSKNAGVQLEANYGFRSYRIVTDSLNFQGRSYEIIEIPLMTHLRFGTGKFSTYLHLGSVIDYVLSAERNNMVDGTEVSAPYELVPNRDNRWNYGLVAGFGAGYQVGPGKLQVEGRYVYHFGNIEQSLLVTRLSQPRATQITAGYFVPIHQLFKKKEKPAPALDLLPPDEDNQ